MDDAPVNVEAAHYPRQFIILRSCRSKRRQLKEKCSFLRKNLHRSKITLVLPLKTLPVILKAGPIQVSTVNEFVATEAVHHEKRLSFVSRGGEESHFVTTNRPTVFFPPESAVTTRVARRGRPLQTTRDFHKTGPLKTISRALLRNGRRCN